MKIFHFAEAHWNAIGRIIFIIHAGWFWWTNVRNGIRNKKHKIKKLSSNKYVAEILYVRSNFPISDEYIETKTR